MPNLRKDYSTNAVPNNHCQFTAASRYRGGGGHSELKTAMREGDLATHSSSVTLSLFNPRDFSVISNQWNQSWTCLCLCTLELGISRVITPLVQNDKLHISNKECIWHVFLCLEIRSKSEWHVGHCKSLSLVLLDQNFHHLRSYLECRPGPALCKLDTCSTTELYSQTQARTTKSI